MSKVEQFKQFLKENSLEIPHGRSENGNHVFALEQRLDCGATVRSMISFDQEETTVGIYVLDYIKLPKKENKPAALDLINEFHKGLMFMNFFITDQDTIALQHFFNIRNAFAPEDIVGQMALMMNVADQKYPEFMRTVWA